jgi:ParB family chromosome partitioning protein
MNTDNSSAKRLGKGLASMISVPIEIMKVPADIGAENIKLSDFNRIAVLQIVPSPYQPRREIDPLQLQALADSIRESGVIQPILVRRVPNSAGANPRYELIAGERRWRAATAAGLVEIPAIVKDVTDEQAAECALIENIQREDLNPMDRAWAVRALCERFHLSHEQLSKKIALERSTITNLVRLTELEPEIAEMIAHTKLSAGHGRTLLGIPSGSKRLELARLASGFAWSVRKLEAAVRQAQRPEAAPDRSPRDAVLRDLERQIGEHLGTKVHIQADKQGKRGRMTFEFYGLEHFDALLTKLGIPTR